MMLHNYCLIIRHAPYFNLDTLVWLTTVRAFKTQNRANLSSLDYANENTMNNLLVLGLPIILIIVAEKSDY